MANSHQLPETVECIVACRTNKAIQKAKRTWKNTDAVCINVDIALFMEDSIEILSKFCGDVNESIPGPSTSTATRDIRSMNDITQRIEKLSPSRNKIAEMMHASPPKLRPGMKELIEYLLEKKIPIYLLSKSLKVIVMPYADELKIREKNLFTNECQFNSEGTFLSCNETLPMSKNYGVCLVLRKLRVEHNYSNIALIGSSPVDVDAMEYADVVIGIEPQQTPTLPEEKYAHWYVPTIETLLDAHKGILPVTKV